MTARIATSLPGQSGDNLSQSCDCSSKESEWFVFDHEVVMPEYIVDFEYVTVVSISYTNWSNLPLICTVCALSMKMLCLFTSI